MGEIKSQLKLNAQIFHAPVALDAVAGAAQELQVVNMVRSSLASGDDVIHFKMLRLKVLRASSAVAVLFPVDRSSVRPVRRELAQVGALWDVSTVHALVEQSELIVHSALDQRC